MCDISTSVHNPTTFMWRVYRKVSGLKCHKQHKNQLNYYLFSFRGFSGWLMSLCVYSKSDSQMCDGVVWGSRRSSDSPVTSLPVIAVLSSVAPTSKLWRSSLTWKPKREKTWSKTLKCFMLANKKTFIWLKESNILTLPAIYFSSSSKWQQRTKFIVLSGASGFKFKLRCWSYLFFLLKLIIKC